MIENNSYENCRYILAVREFHQRNGHLVNDQPTRKLPWGVRLQRLRLIMEETGELLAAIHDEKILDVADSLADLLYVVCGTAVVYGLTVRNLYIRMVVDTKHGRPTPSLQDTEEITKWTVLLTRRLALLFRGIEEDDLHDVQVGIEYTIDTIFAIAAQTGIPLDAVFSEVHASNMSKNLLKTDGVQKYGADPDAALKIVKGPGYRPPDIAGVLALYGYEGGAR